MQIFRTKSEIKDFISQVKSEEKEIGFVPTMGALHNGHLSLVDIAKKNVDVVIVSIFVNPTQFNNKEDLEKYPKTEVEDCKKLQKVGTQAVYIPNPIEVYGDNVEADDLKLYNTNILCGAYRSGHFEGVITVLKKLFDIIKPDVAVFGEKDFQQLWLIKNHFKDIKIIGAPTARDYDGLAMSSRNKRLSNSDLKIARQLNIILRKAIKTQKLTEAKEHIMSAGFSKIDYLEFREEDNLKITKKFTDKTRIFAAVWLGNVRLIDNLK